MRRRPWRGGLGLRGRIVGAVLVTTVATLAVAALALLGPLEHKLRDADLATLRTEVTKTTPQSMGIANAWDPEKVLDYGIYGVHTGKATGKVAEEGLRVRNVLLKTESALQQRYGAAEVAILGLFSSSGEESHWWSLRLTPTSRNPIRMKTPRWRSGNRNPYNARLHRRSRVRTGGNPLHVHRPHQWGRTLAGTVRTRGAQAAR